MNLIIGIVWRIVIIILSLKSREGNQVLVKMNPLLAVTLALMKRFSIKNVNVG